MMISIEADAPAATWGVGLFETMLIVERRVPFLEQHYSRLSASAAALGFPSPSRDAFSRAVREAASVAEEAEAGLRCSWLAAGTDLDDPGNWRLVAQARPLPATAVGRRRNGRVMLLPPDLSRALPNHKTISYLPSIIGLRRALMAGADEGLFTTYDASILEGTMTNVFALRDNRIVTPPVGSVLPGIVRRWVIDCAEAEGLEVEMRPLMAEDLLGGSFMTSSLTRLAPIRSVDGRPAALPSGPFELFCRRLSEHLGITGQQWW